MKLKNGRLEVGKVAGVTVRFHWTALIGAYVFCGFRVDLFLWFCFFALVLLHEVGHALVVKACRARALAIDLTGFGGLCHWSGDVTPIGRAAIAWGGIWAQLLLLVLAQGYQRLAGDNLSPRELDVIWFCTMSNAWIIAVNLIPIAPFDGAEAWRLPILLGRALRRRPAVAVAAPIERDDSGFEESHAAKSLATALLEQARKETAE